MGLARSQRVRHAEEYHLLRQCGTVIHCQSFIFSYLKHEVSAPQPSRLGVIASRKVGNAVIRNKAKRRFREIFRKHQQELSSNCDLVIVVRSNFVKKSYQELEIQFLKACRQIQKK
jgi:ribonuclease P protein component